MATASEVLAEREKAVVALIEEADDLTREMLYRQLYTIGHRMDGIGSRIARLAQRLSSPT